MNGIFISIISGVAFGLFQVVNRRGRPQGDVFQATFILVLVSSVVLIAVTAIFEDLALLRTLSWLALLYFGLAAFIHFFVGWTLLSISQKEVGAARTSVLLGTAPLWATAIGIIFFDEFLTTWSLIGIGLIIVGAYIVSAGGAAPDASMIKTGWWASLPGLGTALCFAASSLLIRYGLVHLPSPLLGVTLGMVLLPYFTVCCCCCDRKRSKRTRNVRFSGSNLWLQIAAGVLGRSRHLVALGCPRSDPDRHRDCAQSAKHANRFSHFPFWLGNSGRRSTAGSGWVQPSY